MTEPKKRGRPSKAEIAAREAAANAQVEGGDAVADTMTLGNYPQIADTTVSVVDSAAQAYAVRVWNGQSISADRAWRIQRVKEALEGQGLSFEGVVLP